MKICLVTLGCPKNVVEGESIAGILHSSGWELTTDMEAADAAVVHTCSFIADAKRESEDVIAGLSSLKEKGRLKILAVTGCLVQAEGKKLKSRYPAIDVLAGTGSLGSLRGLLLKGCGAEIAKPGGLLESKAPRLLSSSLPSAYLRVAEGCNHKCGFCIIPGIRGKYHSRKMSAVLSEAADLVKCGVKEINIIAQDTTLYGRDIYGKLALPELLTSLSKISGLKWIRLMYAFPDTVTRELLSAIKNEAKICKYIDMPVQHVSSRVLKLMGRPAGVKEVVRRVRTEIPELTLRSTLITGFPGETEKDFQELAEFVSEGWFDNLGVFEYSPIEGTPSFSLKGRVSPAVAAKRKNELMAIQREVVKRRFASMKGSRVEALVESLRADGTCLGRTVFQAPEVDGGIIIKANKKPGSFVKAVITGFKGYDLKGEL